MDFGNQFARSDEFQFAAMQQQQQTYVGFEQGVMVAGGGGGGGGLQHGQHHMHDSLDFAAAAFQFQQQGEMQQQMLAMPMPPMAPMQMPPISGMHHGEVLYPALGTVKREGGGGGGPADAGRIGLNLGRRTYFSAGDMMAMDRLLMRSRLGGAPPRCQAEGCKADLSGAKHYHRRHKVCEYHAKASLVAAAGKQQRFCQQCSRFHVLMEFDEAKRSCRKRLAEHNRRRRKPAAAPPPCKKLRSRSSCYTAVDHKTLSSTISSNTSAISCGQQKLDQSKMAATARPTALTLGAPPPEEEEGELSTMLQAQAAAAAGNHHHRHQQHFITSLLHSNNILSCSSVSSGGFPSTVNNGEVSDLSNNMHLFEVDFM